MAEVIRVIILAIFAERHNFCTAPAGQSLRSLSVCPGCSWRVHPAVGTRLSWLWTLGQRRDLGGTRPAEEVMHTMIPKLARPRAVLPRSVLPRAVRVPRPRVSLLLALAVAAGGPVIAATGASAASHGGHGGLLQPGNLLVSGSVYDNDPSLLTPGVTVLPPGCTSGCVTATNDGSY